MSTPLSASRKLLRTVAVPVLLGVLPALACTATAGSPTSGPAVTARVETVPSSPVALARGLVRADEVSAHRARHRAHHRAHRRARMRARHRARMRARHRAALHRRSPASLPVGNRAAVAGAYRSLFADGLNVPTGWTGSVADCAAGTNSAASQRATLAAINFVRRLGGLSPVRLNATLNARARAAALIMAANDQLSHDPSSAWRCFSRVGAQTASRSNLALAYPSVTAAGVVEMYMDDLGDSNHAAGHRRWLMNPFATAMGTGSADTANALQVVGPSNRHRPNPAWVSWPTRGWFPAALEPHGRWSLSAGDARTDFSRARVQVVHNGHRVWVHRYAVENGYAQPTLVWQMPAGTSASGRYLVRVTNIHQRGHRGPVTAHYQVRFFSAS